MAKYQSRNPDGASQKEVSKECGINENQHWKEKRVNFAFPSLILLSYRR